MKKKIVIGLVLMVICVFMILGCHKVEAFSEEIDPQGYINLPGTFAAEKRIRTRNNCFII